MPVADEVMLALSVLALAGALWHGYRKHDYVVGIWWSLSLLWMALFYAVLVFDLLPIQDQIEIRLSLYRPANASLLAGIIVFCINGRLNKWIDFILRRK